MAADVSATALSSQGIDTSQFGSNPTSKFYRKILPGLSTIVSELRTRSCWTYWRF
jgi:hypothetical protein